MDDGGHLTRKSIAQAVAAHERALVAYVAHLLRSTEAARDVVQEAFARLWEQQSGERPRDVLLPEWLFAVSRNLAIDRLRRDRRTRERPMSTLDVESTTDRPTLRLAQADEHRRAIDLLAALPPRQQEAIRLKFQGELSYAQIAAAMRTSENNVAVLIHLGLRRLREQMQ